jgi:hypothetical protein
MEEIKTTLESIRTAAERRLTPGKARAVGNYCDRIDLYLRRASPAVSTGTGCKRNQYGTNPRTGKSFRAQWELLLYYLTEKPGRTITQAEATRLLGFTDLAGVIKRIEENTGIRADRREIVVPTRYNGATRVKQYWIIDEKPNNNQ